MKHDVPQIDVDGWIDSNDLKVPKDGNFIQGRVRGRIKRGVFEDQMVQPARALVQEGDRVLELGSGIGYVTASILKSCAPASYVCFDGNAEVLVYAEAFLATNGFMDVTLRHGVLGQRKGRRAFYCRRPFLRSSLFEAPQRSVERCVVPMHNAKHTFAEIKPNVLICDIEGQEGTVLDLPDLSGLERALIRLNPDISGDSNVARVFAAMARGGLVYDAALSKGLTVAFRRLDVTA